MMNNVRRERARIPANIGKALTDEGLLSWEWVNARLAESRNYWICSVRPDGRPHVRPVWGVYLDGVLYFDGRFDSGWFRNLRANPVVSAHLENGSDAVIIEGRVEVTEGMELAERIAAAYAAKYPPYAPPPDPGGFRLVPERVYAWRGGDVEHTATRWIFTS
jgi:pyridoxine/pyridoxamine 5'-phosphate oxidase